MRTATAQQRLAGSLPIYESMKCSAQLRVSTFLGVHLERSAPPAKALYLSIDMQPAFSLPAECLSKCVGDQTRVHIQTTVVHVHIETHRDLYYQS